MMNDTKPFEQEDLPWAHELNEEHALELSSTTSSEFEKLINGAAFTRTSGDKGGFLVVYDQAGSYSSVNFQWFCQRYGNFLYVDRIVISPSARGQGLAKRLYADLFAFAEASGYERVVCEVNSEPPNPASDAFHAALGFAVVGEAELQGKGKTVRYMEHRL